MTFPLTTENEMDLWKMLRMSRNQLATCRSQLRLVLCAALSAQQELRYRANRRMRRRERNRPLKADALATWRPS